MEKWWSDNINIPFKWNKQLRKIFNFYKFLFIRNKLLEDSFTSTASAFTSKSLNVHQLMQLNSQVVQILTDAILAGKRRGGAARVHSWNCSIKPFETWICCTIGGLRCSARNIKSPGFIPLLWLNLHGIQIRNDE